jgi:hypothetical protein
LLFVLSGVLLSLILALVVDGIGAILTIRKLWLDPASESRGFWILAAVASSLALLSLNKYSFETMLFPLYVLVLGTYISIKAKPGESKKTELDKI